MRPRKFSGAFKSKRILKSQSEKFSPFYNAESFYVETSIIMDSNKLYGMSCILIMYLSHSLLKNILINVKN